MHRMNQRTFTTSPLQLFFITVTQHLISYMTDKASSAVTDMELNHGQGHLSGVGKQMAVLHPILFVIHHLKCTCALVFYTIKAFLLAMLLLVISKFIMAKSQQSLENSSIPKGKKFKTTD